MSRKKLRLVPPGQFARWLHEALQKEGLTVRRTSELLGVTPKTVYDWLKGKGPLHSDHVKAQLVQKLHEIKGKQSQPLEISPERTETLTHRGLDLPCPQSTSQRLANLPAAFRGRYKARAKEIAEWIQRELEEFLRLLEAEYQAKRAKKKHSHPDPVPYKRARLRPKPRALRDPPP